MFATSRETVDGLIYTSDTVVKEVSQLAAYHQAAYMLFNKKVQQKEDFMSGLYV